MKNLGIFMVLLYIFLIIGEVRCVYKAVTCNWEPIGKAELIYTGGALTGAGCIVGWFNIEDE